MTWKEALDRDDPEQYLTFEPHFHTFFLAPRASFDYLTTEAVKDDTGWLFHQITKGDETTNISVEDLDDLVHQFTYCFSHAGVRETSAIDRTGESDERRPLQLLWSDTSIELTGK